MAHGQMSKRALPPESGVPRYEFWSLEPTTNTWVLRAISDDIVIMNDYGIEAEKGEVPFYIYDRRNASVRSYSAVDPTSP